MGLSSNYYSLLYHWFPTKFTTLTVVIKKCGGNCDLYPSVWADQRKDRTIW